jgi:hypothetical protein
VAPLLFQALLHDRWQLLPIVLCLLVPLAEIFRSGGPRGTVVAAAGGVGLFWMFAQGLLIGLKGWNVSSLEQAFGPIAAQTVGVGVICGRMLHFSSGLALNGLMRAWLPRQFIGLLLHRVWLSVSSLAESVTPEAVIHWPHRTRAHDVGQVALNSLFGIARACHYLLDLASPFCTSAASRQELLRLSRSFRSSHRPS